MVFKHSTVILIDLFTLGSYQVEKVSELHNDVAEITPAKVITLGVTVDIA